MGYILTIKNFSNLIQDLKEKYVLYGPKREKGKGRFSATDLITYGEIGCFEELELEEKSDFSAKEILFPPSQTILYFYSC